MFLFFANKTIQLFWIRTVSKNVFVERKPEVNFINIIKAAFLYNSVICSFSVLILKKQEFMDTKFNVLCTKFKFKLHKIFIKKKN